MLLIILERLNLVYNQLNHSLFSISVVYSLGLLQHLLEISGGQQTLQTFVDKIREIIYFSAALFIFRTNIKRGTYFVTTHDFIWLAYSKNIIL